MFSVFTHFPLGTPSRNFLKNVLVCERSGSSGHIDEILVSLFSQRNNELKPRLILVVMLTIGKYSFGNLFNGTDFKLLKVGSQRHRNK